MIDLAERGGYGTENGINLRRQSRAHVAQTLGNKLPREIERRVVGEDQGHNGQAGLILRAQFRHAGKAGHADFDRHGNDALDLIRGAAGNFGGHLHLNIGNVRERVDRKFAGGIYSEADPDGGDDNNHQPLPQNGVNQRMEHPSDSLHREADAFIVQMEGAVDDNAFAGADTVQQYAESTELFA